MILVMPLALALFGRAEERRAHAEATITIDLDARPAVVLPLFGPIREAEWAHGWNPVMLYPNDGHQQAGSVFTTADDSKDIVWVMTRFDKRALKVDYVQVLPNVWAGQIRIRLKDAGQNRTQATVTYQRTALSSEGDQGVDAFGRHFPEQRGHWQEAINHRLRMLAEQHEHN
jgi:hypothetical protein